MLNEIREVVDDLVKLNQKMLWLDRNTPRNSQYSNTISELRDRIIDTHKSMKTVLHYTEQDALDKAKQAAQP